MSYESKEVFRIIQPGGYYITQQVGYKNNEKALFIWEGVSYYLEPKSVDATLEFVNHFAHYESVIAFDYTISISGESIHNYYGAIEFAQSMKKHHQTERFRFNIDEGKIEPFLKQRGLRIISHLNNQEIEKTFLLNDNGSLMGQITGLFRFAMASPNSDTQNE